MSIKSLLRGEMEKKWRERSNFLKLQVACSKTQAYLRGASFQFCELMCTKHTPYVCQHFYYPLWVTVPSALHGKRMNILSRGNVACYMALLTQRKPSLKCSVHAWSQRKEKEKKHIVCHLLVMDLTLFV